MMQSHFLVSTYIVCERLSVMQLLVPVGKICVQKFQFTLFSPVYPPPLPHIEIWTGLGSLSFD